MQNEKIETDLNSFTVGGVEIPIAFIRYHGDATTYITYQSINAYPAMCADDACEDSTTEYDFDIYTDGNYIGILNALKEKLASCGWSWISDSPDMYEEDTKLFHKTTTFEIEE